MAMIEALKLKITAKSDERMFHAGDSIELNLTAGVVNYMVGSNGCGKSTLLHAIRSYKDSIYELLSHGHKSDFARGHDLLLYKDKFDVDGLDQFEHVFTLDAVEDNPISFEKAASATALIDGADIGLCVAPAARVARCCFPDLSVICKKSQEPPLTRRQKSRQIYRKQGL